MAKQVANKLSLKNIPQHMAIDVLGRYAAKGHVISENINDAQLRKRW